MATSKAEQMQKIVAQYRASGEQWPATSGMLAAWAIRKRLWDAPRASLIELAAKDFAYAMREEFFTDPQNRRVRKKHVVPRIEESPEGAHKQLNLWIDIEEASPEDMEKAFQYRRGQILGDCRHLKTDVDSYNDNNEDGAHIQILFDFGEDLAESEQPTEYVGAGA